MPHLLDLAANIFDNTLANADKLDQAYRVVARANGITLGELEAVLNQNPALPQVERLLLEVLQARLSVRPRP